MDEYQYKPILSKEQIAKYLKFRCWQERIGSSIILIGGVLTLWIYSYDPVNNTGISSLVLAVSTLVPLGIAGLIEQYNPNCKPLRRAKQAQLQRLSDEFEEVERRVANIFCEPCRDYVTRYEFEEIKKRVAELPACSSRSDQAELVSLIREIEEKSKRMQVILSQRQNLA